MDLREFVIKYGDRKITYKKPNWVILKVGTVIQEGDEARGITGKWNKVHSPNIGRVYDKSMVSIRRGANAEIGHREVVAPTNPIEFQMCPSCGNRFPLVITRCVECGHTM